MNFAKPWMPLTSSDGIETRVPVLDVLLRAASGQFLRQVFVVDSGADVSTGPRHLCEVLGLDWSAGSPVQLRGISPREECVVQAMTHQLDVYIRDAACRLTIPFCFADGDAPLLLGRDGFFDAFLVQFDKLRQLTRFEMVTPDRPKL